MKKQLNMLTSFIPWIGFNLISSFDPTIAILFAILVSLLSYQKLRQGFVIDWASLIFFILLFFDSYCFQNVWLFHHMSVVGSFFFVAIAGCSLLMKKPFTSQYAKREVEKEKWHSPHFLKINQMMTAGFGIIFLCMASIGIYRTLHPGFLNSWIVWGVGCFIQLLFIDKFPKWYRTKHLPNKDV